MNENIDFYYTPSDLTSSKIINKENLRIGGLVQEDSIESSQDSLETNFFITCFSPRDASGTHVLLV